MIDKLPGEEALYGNSAYTDYDLEVMTLEKKCKLLKILLKSNAKEVHFLE